MLRVLLAKDLRRAWRNPLPSLINIALPICITALIGLAFGGRSGNELEKIKFAIVDEDQSFLSTLLRGAMNQKQTSEHLAPVFVDRATALRQINDNEISGALIIPTNFTHDYFSGDAAKFELIKNPAQSIQPAALEELAGTAVTVLNALARNFKAQFPDWRDTFKGDVDLHRVSTVLEHVGDRMAATKKYIDPPLVSYEKEATVARQEQAFAMSEKETPARTNSSPASVVSNAPVSDAPANKAPTNKASVSNAPGTSVAVESPKPVNAASKPSDPQPKTSSNFSRIFAWVLPGVSAMFLLFLANTAMTDLYREMRFRTFERYQTMQAQLLPFVVSKVLFAVVFLLLCGAIMLGGGGLIFRVSWEQPLALTTLVIAYSCCAAGLMALLVAIVPNERRAATLNSVVAMLLGFAGGCMFPARQLPPLIRDHVTPLLPSYWFVSGTRALQDGDPVAWGLVSLKLVVVSAICIVLAVAIFQSRFKKGLRA